MAGLMAGLAVGAASAEAMPRGPPHAGIATNSRQDYAEKPNSVGIASPVCDIKVVDEAGRTLPANELGELWVRGPNVFPGYWEEPEATAAATALDEARLLEDPAEARAKFQEAWEAVLAADPERNEVKMYLRLARDGAASV